MGETKSVSVEHESRCGAVAIKRVPQNGMPMVGPVSYTHLDVYKRQAIILAEVIVKYLPLGKRLWSIVVGAVLYRLVLVIILAMNVDAQMLKLASAILLAIILYVPEVRQKLKIRPNKSLTPGGDK